MHKLDQQTFVVPLAPAAAAAAAHTLAPLQPTTNRLSTSSLDSTNSSAYDSSDDVYSSNGSSKSNKARYKARRQRAMDQKVHAGRKLQMTEGVGPNGKPIEVCCDVVLERVTSKRQPKMMTDSDVERLLSMSAPAPSTLATTQPTVVKQVQVKQVQTSPSQTSQTSQPQEKEKSITTNIGKRVITTISDSQVEALLKITSGY